MNNRLRGGSVGIMLLDRHEDLDVTHITPGNLDIVTCKACVRDMKTNRSWRLVG